VRAPRGALSGQDSEFLPIYRMITGLSDAALAAPEARRSRRPG
jgi:hypothetical protein